MKLLYSAGNRIGANTQLKRFLDNLNKKHEIKIAAYLKSSEFINHIQWTLDSLHVNILPQKQIKKIWNLFGHRGMVSLNLKNAKILLLEIAKYNPDLIICDGEPIVAHVAKSLKIPLWYCSPLHLLDGIEWERNQLKYTALLENSKKWIQKFPKADKYFIYSPFGDIKFRPFLKDGYEWITPYHLKVEHKEYKESKESIAVINDSSRCLELMKILNSLNNNISLFSSFNENFSHIKTYKIDDEKSYLNKLEKTSGWYFSMGDTNYIADSIYNNCNSIISPSLNDAENLINASLVNYYDIGIDLGQVELMESFAVYEIEKSFKEYKKDYLSIQSYPKLHEVIDAYSI